MVQNVNKLRFLLLQNLPLLANLMFWVNHLYINFWVSGILHYVFGSQRSQKVRKIEKILLLKQNLKPSNITNIKIKVLEYSNRLLEI